MLKQTEMEKHKTIHYSQIYLTGETTLKKLALASSGMIPFYNNLNNF